MATCRACGHVAPDDARFCPICGNALGAAPGAPAPPGPGSAAPAPGPSPWHGAPPSAPAPTARPTGVTILAIIYALGAVALLLGGLLLAVMGPLLSGDPEFRRTLERDLPPLLGTAGTALVLLGVLALALAAGYGAMAYGFWKARPWAWTLAIAFALLGLGFGVVSLAMGDVSAVLNVALNAFLLWYLTREGVKRWFGKAEAAQALPGYAPPPSGF